MLHYKKFVKDLGVLGFVLTLARFKGIAILAILTKSLGPESYGIWAQILITLNLMTPITMLGLTHSLMRFLPGTKTTKEAQEHIWSITAVIFAISLIATLPLFIFPKIIGGLLQTPANLIILLGFLVILESIDVLFMSVFRAFGEIGKYSLLNLILVAGEIAFIAISISIGYGLFGAILSIIIIRLLILFYSLFIVFGRVGVKIPDFSSIKMYLKFGVPTVISNISHWTVQASDRYLIGGFMGIIFVGYYAPAYTIGLIINLFILPIILILQPLLSKLFSDNKLEEIQKYLSYSLKYILLITIPAVFGLIVLSNQVLIIFSTYEISTKAAIIIPFVAIGVLLYGISGIFSQVLYLFKKTNIIGAIWVGTAIVSITLNLIFIPIFGILGAAITTLTAYIIALSLIIFHSNKYLSFPIDWMFIGKSTISAIIMYVVLFLFNANGLNQTILAVIFGIIIYSVSVISLKTFSKNEIEFFKTFLK